MHRYLPILFLVLLPCLSASELGDNVGDLISEIFDEPKTANDVVKNRPPSSECVCVPYYLCQNNTVITDGVGLIDIRQKGGLCDNYFDVCCNQQPLQEENRITPPPVVHTGCGKRNPEGIGFRITGDQDGEAQFGEFPWVVAVLKEDTLNVFKCGGSLIHREVVMTAAHCVTKNEKYKVRVGEWDTQTNNEIFPHQDVFVKNVVIHPKYYPSGLYYDVALLFLEEPVDIADNVDVVCLPEQDAQYDFTRCYATGWGKDFFGQEGKYQVIMKKVDLSIVPHNTCQENMRQTRLGPYFDLHESFICAGGERGKDTCTGDGGSPLSCPVGTGGKYNQVGIVSWGIGCGTRGAPGVYANVASFRTWIDQQFDIANMDRSVYLSYIRKVIVNNLS